MPPIIRCFALAGALLAAGCGTSGGGAGSDSGVPGDAGASFPDAGTGPLRAGLVIDGQPDAGQGIFDPSAAWDDAADAGLLAYSVVAPDQAQVHSRLAASTNRGASWSFVSEPDQAGTLTISTSDSTVCGQPACSGNSAHEVPSLIVDPLDTPARRLKLFTHTYFVDAGGNLHLQLGHIELHTAPSAAGPWSSAPLLGWSSSSSYSTQGVAQDISTDPRLSGVGHCLLLTEPGALVRTTSSGPVLELAVGCVFLEGTAPQIEIDLLRSTDHAASFSFVATLLSASDATALGATDAQINAPDLFESGGQIYLFATPAGPVTFATGSASGYRGCLLLQFADIESGALVRGANGVPALAASYLGGAGQFIGACTALDALPGLGVAGDVLDILSSSPFGISGYGRVSNTMFADPHGGQTSCLECGRSPRSGQDALVGLERLGHAVLVEDAPGGDRGDARAGGEHPNQVERIAGGEQHPLVARGARRRTARSASSASGSANCSP